MITGLNNNTNNGYFVHNNNSAQNQNIKKTNSLINTIGETNKIINNLKNGNGAERAAQIAKTVMALFGKM